MSKTVEEFIITRSVYDEAVKAVENDVWGKWPYQSITTGANYAELVCTKLFGKREELMVQNDYFR